MIRVLLLILKTLGDFFLDANGDGDPHKFFAALFFIVGLCCIWAFWEMTAGLIIAGIALYILSIWADKGRVKKPPAQDNGGLPRS